jgi:hypothetical protein
VFIAGCVCENCGKLLKTKFTTMGKLRLAEISGAGGGRDALKFKIDASGGSDYNQRRQKK